MWKPIAAGISIVVLAVLIYAYALFTLLLALAFESPWHLRIVIPGFGIATLALLSGIFSLIRKKWGFVFFGSIVICVVSIIFLIMTYQSLIELPAAIAWIGVVPLVLVAFSKKEFKTHDKKDQ